MSYPIWRFVVQVPMDTFLHEDEIATVAIQCLCHKDRRPEVDGYQPDG